MAAIAPARDEAQGFAFHALHHKLRAILSRHDLDLGQALLDGFFEQAGDIEQAIKDPMAALAYWLSFEQVVLEYKWSLLPPPEERKTNNWAGDMYGRIKIIARFKRIYPPKTPDVDKRVFAVLGIKGEAQLPLCECKTLADATACIEKDAAEVRSIMPTKKDETSQPPLMDDSKPKINLVALGVKIGEVFANYELPYNGANYKAATGDIGAPGSIDNGKSESTILSQVEGWCMEQKQAKKTDEKKSEPALGDEIDLDLSDGAKKLQTLLDAEKKTEDAPSANGEAPSLSGTANPSATDQPKPTMPVSEPVLDKAHEPEAIEAQILLEGEENVDGREYDYDATYLPKLQRWDVNLLTFCVFTDEQKADITKRTEGVLKLSQDVPVSINWITEELSADLINALRTECYGIIEDSYGEDYQGNAGEQSRRSLLTDIWKDAPTPGTKAAWMHFGREGALALVKARGLEETKRRQAEEAERFKNQQALVLVPPPAQAQAMMVIQPNSPIKVPTEPEMKLMDRMASFAYRCKIYPNEAAAFLAIYRGFELGFGISTSIEWIYAFEGKGGKISTMPSANAYAAICLNSPLCERFSVFNDTQDSATCIVQRKGQAQQTFRYTRADAEKANLLNKPAWVSNLKMMLCHRVARSTAELVFADVCAALGLQGAGVELDEEMVDAGDLPQAAGF